MVLQNVRILILIIILILISDYGLHLIFHVIPHDGLEMPVITMLLVAILFMGYKNHHNKKKYEISKELQKSNERFYGLFNSMPSGVVIYKYDKKRNVFIIKDFNKASERLTGYKRKDVIGTIMTEKFPGTFESGYKQALLDCYYTEKPLEVLSDYYIKDNIRQYSKSKIHKSSTGEIISVYEDVRAEKKVERAKEKVEETLRQVIDNIPFPIYQKTRSGKILLANKSAADFVGIPVNRVTGMYHQDVHPNPDESTIMLKEDKYIVDNNEALEHLDFESTDKQGETKYFHLRRIPFKTEYSDETTVLAIAIDVTDKHHQEIEIIEKARELRKAQKMKALGTLAGGLAHDFNNILHIITNTAQLLQYQFKEENESVNIIVDTSKKGSFLTKRLLIFGQRNESDLIPTNINQILEGLQEMLSSFLPKMINIDFNYEYNMSTILADQSQLEQLFVNLVTNAKDAIGINIGNIKINTSVIDVTKECPIKYSFKKYGKYVKVEVIDDGCGMTKEVEERVFEPFFTTKELSSNSGTGLGMSTVYGIIENHKGVILINTKHNKGTAFEIYFPIVDKKVELIVKENINSESLLKDGDETLLVVDDEEEILNSTMLLLNQFGYKCIGASSGEEAIEKYKEKQDEISLVIIDLMMPGIGGHEGLIEILKLDPEAKIIVASGQTINGEVKEATQSGAKAFIGKPFIIEKLVIKIRKIIDDKE